MQQLFDQTPAVVPQQLCKADLPQCLERKQSSTSYAAVLALLSNLLLLLCNPAAATVNICGPYTA
jgi:hypothetical protein